MVLEERAQICSTLYRGIKLYCDHNRKLLESKDQTEIAIGTRIALDFPQALMELGFFVGRSDWIKAAGNLEEKIAPTTEVNVCLFDEVTKQGEFIFTMANYEKPREETTWQQWRLDSIISQHYRQLDFPAYMRSECRNATTTTAKIRTNQSFSANGPGIYHIIRGGKMITLPFHPQERRELSATSSYRYEYIIGFEEKIPETIAVLLPRVS